MDPRPSPRIYIDVLLPLPLPGTFTYSVPAEIAGLIRMGIRVVVQFGNRKLYTALVRRMGKTPEPGREIKEIQSVLDAEPLVREWQFEFWEWLADYYMCTPGEVMNAALPSAFKLASETRVAIHPAYVMDSIPLNEKEFTLVETLFHRKKSIEISSIKGITDQQKIIPLIRNLLEKGIIVLEEEVREKYRPRTETWVALAPPYSENEDRLRELFDHLERKAGKQLELLMNLIRLSEPGRDRGYMVRKDVLLKKSDTSSAVLGAMLKKGILETLEKKVQRDAGTGNPSSPGEIAYSAAQQKAIREIREAWTARDTVLLHGVTSSGKTEIYIGMIAETLAQGKQVLYLLPEIALTTQIISRLRKYFGNRVGVYHSRFNESERAEVWKNMTTACFHMEGTDHTPAPVHQEGQDQTSHPEGGIAQYDVILGARSAVFLPFRDLGLVIVDEEHDTSFKQADPAPRYHGRDAALYLARIHGAKALLGSATPAIETYYHSEEGKYALVSLPERYGDMELPGIQVVSIRQEAARGRMKSHFSEILLNKLKETLENKLQAILFQNRRGFSLRLECETCNWMPSCRNCDVTLVYHKKNNQLRCHYCGYVSSVPPECPSCHSKGIRMKGFGTEKVEEELELFFPEAKIVRMDLDSTRSRQAHQQIITGFEEMKIDILVGTQMVTKGLDFDHVNTVCILNADNMLSFPDFRSGERSFQLMAQVSGRSGRKGKRGRVLIQTFNPGNPVIRFVVGHDYSGMYQAQLKERRKFRYPPFHRLVLIKVKHRDQNLVNQAAASLASRLKKIFGNRVLGPEYPPVARIMNYYLKNILVKVEKDSSFVRARSGIIEALNDFHKEPRFHSVKVLIDVDPQ